MLYCVSWKASSVEIQLFLKRLSVVLRSWAGECVLRAFGESGVAKTWHPDPG